MICVLIEGTWLKLVLCESHLGHVGIDGLDCCSYHLEQKPCLVFVQMNFETFGLR